MTILYETTFGDLVSYERYRYDHSPYTGTEGFIMSWGPLLPAFPHAVIFSNMGRPVGLLETIVALVILFIIWKTIFRSIRRWCCKKGIWQIFREANRYGLMGPRELELEGDNLIEVSDYDIRTTPLDAVEKIVTTEQYAFMYTGATTAFVIPRRYLRKKDFESFVALVSEACWAKEMVLS